MVRVRRRDGTIVEGFVRNEGNQTLPVQTVDGRLYSLEKGSYTRLPVERPSLMPRVAGHRKMNGGISSPT